jgi:prepilin-type N-terminal cleavage/methylation domain-containing protein
MKSIDRPDRGHMTKGKNYRGFTLVEMLLVILLVGIVGFGGYYVWDRNQDIENQNTADTSTDAPAKEDNKANNTKLKKFTSKLYPNMSFDVRENWEVQEDEDYTASDIGLDGSADADIVVWLGDKTNLQFSLKTVRPTGFEGYSCYNYPSVVKVGDVYRITQPNGDQFYRNGVTPDDKEWAEVKNQEFSDYKEGFSNYCVSFPFLRTYESTLNQSDFSNGSFGYAGKNNKVYVWLEAKINGPTNDEILEQTDLIIKSLSKSDEFN